LALPANIKLSWKGLPVSDSSLLGSFVNYDSKFFKDIGTWTGLPLCGFRVVVVVVTWHQGYKTFFPSLLMLQVNMLELFPLARL